MIKSSFHILLLFICSVMHVQACQMNALQEKYQNIFNQFDQLSVLNIVDAYAMMPNFFITLPSQYWVMIKQVHHDLAFLKKQIRQCKKNKNSTLDQQCAAKIVLQDKMTALYKFLKKYRILYEVVYFEQQVLSQFEKLFQIVRNGLDVETLLLDFGIEQTGRDGLKLLLKQVVRNLAKIEYDERRLHADWIDAKLSNYVLKIELVRLRNAILFHPSYNKVRFVFSSNYPR